MLLFSNLTFWMVFMVFVTVFAIIRGYSRLAMLLYVVGFSLFFCWLANSWQMLLLPACAFVGWGSARWIRSVDNVQIRKEILAVSIVVSLLPLLYFKYANFAIATFNEVLKGNFALLDIALPVGISFFTFQSISYLVDVYRCRFTRDVTYLEFLFYLSFFPLLLAGPITRAQTLIPQIQRKGLVSSRLFYTGLYLALLGLLKKAVIADYIAQYNNWIFDDPLAYSGFECLMGILGYTVQVYCDFSGYSDMSIGIAAMMGFSLKENFNFPYAAHNVSDFWRRWHISLSTWFRDYLYIPLGGNRRGKFRTYLNNFITMLVAGLWHGSSWMFVLWGSIHGFGLIVNKMLRPQLQRIPDSKWVRGLSICITFVFVAIAWVFFRAESVPVALRLLMHTVVDFDLAYLQPFVTVRTAWVVLVSLTLLSQFVSRRQSHHLQMRFVCLPWILKLLIVMLVFQVVVQFSTSSVIPFLYYQF